MRPARLHEAWPSAESGRTRKRWSADRPYPEDCLVALAIVRCRAAARSKQSCGAAHTDARYWAEAGAGPFAEFATRQRSEPSMSKRSGSCADVREAFAHPRWLR